MIKKKLTNIVFSEIQKNYIKEYKNTLEECIYSDKFQMNLDSYTKDRDLSVFSLFHLFYDCLFPIHQIPKDKWFKDVYKWALSKSFPDKYDLNLSFNEEYLYKFYLNIIDLSKTNLKDIKESEFISKYPISVLTLDEEKQLGFPHEYFNFKSKFKELYIYQIMYLDMIITGHNTLDHVIGVNYVAMHIARQLKALGLPVDLGTMVGASLGHDIGKYGVLKEDLSLVPYFHYYYTEYWFNRFNMTETGHIATNHSTWDLELQSLPLESLILIYSDFRVKNKVKNNEYTMNIYDLDDSFHVILSKLDNVDQTKESRYKKVYNKLKDFENYMVSLGVDTTPSGSLKPKTRKQFELMNTSEVIENMKYISIDHNINLMAKLTDNVSFDNILEMARGEENWRKLRLYIEIFKSYSTYLTQNQKITTLNFLSDLLLHAGEDIRKESSELIGKLIALYDEEYRKELPDSVILKKPSLSSEDILDQFLDMLLFPDHKIAYYERNWIYNLKILVKSLFKYSNKAYHIIYFDIINKYYKDYKSLSQLGHFYLTQTVNFIPLEHLDDNRIFELYDFTLKQLESKDLSIRLSTLNMIYDMLLENENIVFIASIRNWIQSNLSKSLTPAENYLKYIIAERIDLPKDNLIKLSDNYLQNEEESSDIFLANLKSDTQWIEKKINIDILYDQVVKLPTIKGFHTAMHLCNLLKVSQTENVRNYSGSTLIKMFPLLSMRERNDVCIELIRALEMENYQFTKFIPYYIGRLILYLAPNELDEFLDDFESKLKISNIKIKYLLLNTIAICIESYNFYITRFDENKVTHDNRLNRLMGLLSISMSSYDIDVKNEALRVMSSILFDSDILDLKDKFKLFKIIGKKILTFLDYNKEDEFLFYNNAASLNHIYQFLSEYQHTYGFVIKEEQEKIAFFPGTFDPFSLSHKNIAIEIRNLGFKVYLAVDEFSWSKRTEPHVFRRNIINMSISNEKDIYIFPDDIPINISNPKDLKTLKNIFLNKSVSIVVGSDVLTNASAYKIENPILDFPHIIFERKSSLSENSDEKDLEESINNIRGDVIRLTLPPQYEDISSTQIRNSIDSNRDISKLIDPLAQSYIYDYGLYLREPQYKTLFSSKDLKAQLFNRIEDNLLEKIKETFPNIDINHLLSFKNKANYKFLVLKDVKKDEILGFSSFYWLRQKSIYREFQNSDITEYLRENIKGRIILIPGIYTVENNENLVEILLNEVLSVAITSDYTVALYINSNCNEKDPTIEEQLVLQGFIKTNLKYNENPLFIVDMNKPCTLNLDLISMIKPPYNENPKILDAIRYARNKLKREISNLYPGELLLTFNKDMIYSKLIQNICDSNGVSIYQSQQRNLGPNMCVPFGSILNSSIIPNTVTKTMHTEKIFDTSINDFTIKSFPFYLSLQEQAKVLKSFNRPVILVDDLLHKGYRLNVIEPVLREAGVKIEKIIVAILTGRGEEIGISKGIDLDSAYFVPNLKVWFNESSQYPFIGGDMVGSHTLQTSSIPSINMILPYVSPTFIKNTKNESIYKLSVTCLKNSINIFKAIEEVYHNKNEKSLNLKNLGEVFNSPRHPDTNQMIFLNKYSKPSEAIEVDLAYLKRLENIIIR